MFSRTWQYLTYLLGIGLLVAVLSACQAGEDTPEAVASPTRILGTPIQVLIQTQSSQAIATLPAGGVTGEDAASSAGTGQPGGPDGTVEPLQPAQTRELSPSSTPTPLPEPTFYVIESGDTLVGIADKFGISIDALVFANGAGSTGEIPLVVGEQLQIPQCKAHRLVSGNTLAGIAQLCGLTLDDLLIANIPILAPIGTLEGVPLGTDLAIPEERVVPADIDCSPQPTRQQVIEYQPGPGEGPFCLSQKFSVSASAIVHGNVERLVGNEYGSVPLLIPPVNGALYVVTEQDISNEIQVADLAAWYDVEPEAVTDWNGNPVSGPLDVGRQLFINGANLIYGRFRSQPSDAQS